MQGKIFRVAHLGFFDYLDTVAFLGAMEHIAKDTLGLPVEYGQAWPQRKRSTRKQRSDSGASGVSAVPALAELGWVSNRLC